MNALVGNKINYHQYRFGRSQQRFRGPKPNLDVPYIAFIGGSEVFGKFVPDPFPDILAKRLDHSVANWGTPGAGASFFLRDPVVLEACSKSKVCVISAMGAVSMSNRLYSVFKRRNSRISGTSDMLRALYPTMDLSEFRFAHNMLRSLYRESAEKFAILEVELQQAWVARMCELMDDIETTKVLLWMSTRAPEDDAGPQKNGNFVRFPAFVNRDMFENVAEMADVVVEYVADSALYGDPDDGRIYDGGERSAIEWPGPTMHAQTADLLEKPLLDILNLKLG